MPEGGNDRITMFIKHRKLLVAQGVGGDSLAFACAMHARKCAVDGVGRAPGHRMHTN